MEHDHWQGLPLLKQPRSAPPPRLHGVHPPERSASELGLGTEGAGHRRWLGKGRTPLEPPTSGGISPRKGISIF